MPQYEEADGLYIPWVRALVQSGIAMGEGAKASLAAYDHILMSKPVAKSESAAA